MNCSVGDRHVAASLGSKRWIFSVGKQNWTVTVRNVATSLTGMLQSFRFDGFSRVGSHSVSGKRRLLRALVFIEVFAVNGFSVHRPCGVLMCPPNISDNTPITLPPTLPQHPAALNIWTGCSVTH